MKGYVIFLALAGLIVLMFSGSASAITLNTTPLSNYSNIYVNVSNVEGVSFNTTGNGTYYIQSLSAPNGGFNAVHIANNSATSLNYGSPTLTTNQSGTFYATDSGGRGYQDDVVLLVAVNGTIPDNFMLQLTVDGYNWTPSGVLNQPPSLGSINPYGVTLNETFTKSDFLYGLQDWKPTGGNDNYPIFYNENMSDPNNMFYLMFIDTHAGLLGYNYPGGNSQFINNGAVQINYTFYNLESTAAFNIYAWNMNTTQGQGMLWTNSILPGQTGGPSGYVVNGSPTPIAAFTASPTSGKTPLNVQFTDESTGATPLTYLWNFGDNSPTSTSTSQNPSHTYTSQGNFLVTLTVTNAFGSDETNTTISVIDLNVTNSVPSGIYNTTLSVNLTASQTLSSIFYTLNGTAPNSTSTLYTNPITISNQGTTTLEYIAYKGSLVSYVGTAVYTIDETPPTVTVNPGGGTYNIAKNVTLTTTDMCSTVTYYTTDGTNPMTSNTGTVYSSPISITSNTTLKYAALDAAGNWSPIYTVKYTMVPISAPVTSANLASGSYTTNQLVSLSAVDAIDPNPTIYYTENGTDPTINSTIYYQPIPIYTTGTTVLKFIAANYAGLVSNETTLIFNLTKPACSGTWTTSQIDSNVLYNSIAIDASGYPHIAYYQYSLTGAEPILKYAYENASGWHTTDIESTPAGSGYYVSLVLDSLGYPHMVYEDIFGDGNPNVLRYVYEDANGWHYTNLTSPYSNNPLGDVIENCNLVLYNNQPRISFYNQTGGQIEYMYLNGTSWITEIADSKGGPCNSLAIDSSGNPVISFYSISPDSGIGSLRILRGSSNGTWTMDIVDNSADNVGQSNSLALDSSGNAYIAYTYNDGSLRYAYYNGTNWISTIVSDLPAQGCKLLMDSSNSPMIIFEDVGSTDLEYAFQQGTSWVIHNIDSTNDTFGLISAVYNSSDVPFVSYETASFNLRYGYLEPFTVTATPSGGTYTTNQTVTMTSTPGTAIYYTTDGSNPTTSSTKILYKSPLIIKNTTSINFAATDSSDDWSQVFSDTYNIVAPVTNDRTGKTFNSIQSAIDDQTTLNGDTLTVGGGSYIENVVVDKSVILNTAGSVYISPLNTALPVFTIDSNGSSVEGFIISGSSNSGIYVNNVTATNLANNVIYGNGTMLWGICMVDCNGPNNITGNSVYNCTEGINLYGVNGANITNNNAIGNEYDGVALTSSSNNTITSNNGTTLNVSGFRLITGSNNNTISNNNLTGNIWTSISLVNSLSNQITGNIASNDQEGMYLYASNNNTVSGNTADNNLWDGIAVASSNNNIIKNNVNVTSNNSGIRIIGVSSGNQVSNNVVTGNTWADMSLDTAGNTTITGNIFNNTEEGIFIVNSNGNTITNNNMNNDTWDGIYLGTSNNNNITGNIMSNGGYGVRIQGSTGNKIITNDFYNNYNQAYDDGDNTWNNTTTGNYYNNWNSTNPRPVDGGSAVDNHPSLTPF